MSDAKLVERLREAGVQVIKVDDLTEAELKKVLGSRQESLAVAPVLSEMSQELKEMMSGLSESRETILVHPEPTVHSMPTESANRLVGRVTMDEKAAQKHVEWVHRKRSDLKSRISVLSDEIATLAGHQSAETMSSSEEILALELEAENKKKTVDVLMIFIEQTEIVIAKLQEEIKTNRASIINAASDIEKAEKRAKDIKLKDLPAAQAAFKEIDRHHAPRIAAIRKDLETVERRLGLHEARYKDLL